MPAKYLSQKEIADIIGVKLTSLANYKLPPPDAYIGRTRGWLPETIEKWNASRPGRGYRADLEGPYYRPDTGSETTP